MNMCRDFQKNKTFQFACESQFLSVEPQQQEYLCLIGPSKQCSSVVQWRWRGWKCILRGQGMKNRFKISFAGRLSRRLLPSFPAYRKGHLRWMHTCRWDVRCRPCWGRGGKDQLSSCTTQICMFASLYVCLLHFQIYYWVAEIYVRPTQSNLFVGRRRRRFSLQRCFCSLLRDGTHSGYLIWFPGHLPITVHVISPSHQRWSSWVVVVLDRREEWPMLLLKTHTWIYIIIVWVMWSRTASNCFELSPFRWLREWTIWPIALCFCSNNYANWNQKPPISSQNKRIGDSCSPGILCCWQSQ